MKRILALMVAGVLFVSSSVCVFATDTGSKSITAEDVLKEEVDALKGIVEKQNEYMDKQAELLDKQSGQISTLINAVIASKSNSGASSGSSGGGSRSQGAGSAATDVRTIMLAKNNAVSYGSNIVSQGGHVEINGGKSNVTFMVSVPDSGTVSSAASLATSVGGSLINCVAVSSTVAFKTAKVNFYVTGVNVGDNVAVYQAQGGKWVQLQTPEIRKDHVIVNMSQTGTVAFIRVPVLAATTN
ncbi:MAG: hypothetical protein J6N21_04225 [Butyrivibrio sp.]|nr:hypothetical protein [Butyrivibrio sp.]